MGSGGMRMLKLFTTLLCKWTICDGFPSGVLGFGCQTSFVLRGLWISSLKLTTCIQLHPESWNPCFAWVAEDAGRCFLDTTYWMCRRVWECNQMAVLEACRAVTLTHQELDQPMIGLSEFMPLRAEVHTLTGWQSMSCTELLQDVAAITWLHCHPVNVLAWHGNPLHLATDGNR